MPPLSWVLVDHAFFQGSVVRVGADPRDLAVLFGSVETRDGKTHSLLAANAAKGANMRLLGVRVAHAKGDLDRGYLSSVQLAATTEGWPQFEEWGPEALQQVCLRQTLPHWCRP